MGMQDTDFWRRAGETATKVAPGLFDFGVNAVGANAARKEADARLRTAQGPVYDQAMNLAGGQLAAGGNFDPKVAAAERLATQQGLLAGSDAKSEADMMRMLHSKGMLGAANYNPGVEGIAPSSVAMNPHMAAFYAGRGARDAKMAAGALDAGEAQLDRYLNRSGMLTTQAGNVQNTGLQAQRTQPSKAAGNMNMVKGAQGVLKDAGIGVKDIAGGIGGMLKGGWDWLNGASGYAPMDFDFGDLGSFDFGGADLFDWSI